VYAKRYSAVRSVGSGIFSQAFPFLLRKYWGYKVKESNHLEKILTIGTPRFIRMTGKRKSRRNENKNGG
jgi:hypothetical protein